ncbi:unnamed protein product [Owenia fusiformis]|uniref:Uncharacterized protein n=1 Tax=Owenia fusiformis TaxID=6347 RepID=A0A8J1UU38_OWEFU|nr:unnamed protein product [Owenia fusiformis]
MATRLVLVELLCPNRRWLMAWLLMVVCGTLYITNQLASQYQVLEHKRWQLAQMQPRVIIERKIKHCDPPCTNIIEQIPPEDVEKITDIHQEGDPNVKIAQIDANDEYNDSHHDIVDTNYGRIVNIKTDGRINITKGIPSRTKKPETSDEVHIPSIRTIGANCSAVFQGDNDELQKAENYMKSNPKIPIPDKAYVTLASDCDRFRKSRSYILSALTKEEEEFPIAFSILMFKDIEQTERLLRAIYRPQNYYCIHMDVKSNPDVKKGITAIAQCFDNVIIASELIDVQWGAFTVLEPELRCMKDLWAYKKWKYFINLTGQEFPLRTNWELVKILKAYNGANNLEGTVKRRNMERFTYVHNPGRTDEKKEPPPHGIVPVKGSVHVTASRDFVDYLLHNKTALEFLEWAKTAGIPDESFFSSLNHNPHLGVPGSYAGEPETDPQKYPFITRFKNWGNYPFNYPCKGGNRVRMICILSLGDLPYLKTRPELFMNKFYIDYSYLGYDCLEEWYFERTRNEYLGKQSFDVGFYENLSFVKNQVKAWYQN